ncbi:MAG: prepilin peptidase [Planctomycetota bacterium]
MMLLFASSSTDLVLYLPDVMRVFLAVWLFVVGSCVGSFVNVVVYRLPVGLGIARGGSRCPACSHPIRWFDNIPIISWLVLRGRCRDCHAPIALRYPLVELTVAVIFLTLGLVEGLSGGDNLPRPASAPRPVAFTAFECWALYAFHLLAIVTLLAAALIERDRREVPRRLFVPAWGVGLVAPVGLPFLHPVPALAGRAPGGALRGLVAASWGAVAGAGLGGGSWPATGRQLRRTGGVQTVVFSSATVGLYFGWQAASAIVTLTSVAFFCGSAIDRWNTQRGRGGWCGYLVPTLLLYLVFWRPIVNRFPALGEGGTGWLLLLSTLTVLLVSAATAWVTPRREFAQAVSLKGQRMASPIDREQKITEILESQSYLPVEYDAEFLQQWETRPVRVQLELLKPEIGLKRQGIQSTIVVFGGTQVVEPAEAEKKLRAAREALKHAPHDPQRKRDVARLVRVAAKSHYYNMAREFACLVSSTCQLEGNCDYVIATGGGPGIMEAANRGACDASAKSIGLNITLPAEQVPNPYVTSSLCFQFHYFALRKMHFLLRAKAMVVFPGGFGTLDELFDALTLRQTNRMQEIPIILFGREFWQQVINFQFLADEGVVADEHLDLISFVETPQEAWDIIARFHGMGGQSTARGAASEGKAGDF